MKVEWFQPLNEALADQVAEDAHAIRFEQSVCSKCSALPLQVKADGNAGVEPPHG
jgi:hypothetical protein